MTPERESLANETSYLLNDSGNIVHDEILVTDIPHAPNYNRKVFITLAVVAVWISSIAMIMSSSSAQSGIKSLQLSSMRGKNSFDATSDSLPTAGPTFGPTHTVGPTADADIVTPVEPTDSPTEKPSTVHMAPIEVYTSHPTVDKTYSPTQDKTYAPTEDKTSSPTDDRTSSPTVDTTSAPTLDKTSSPTVDMTPSPTVDKTSAPSAQTVTSAPTESISDEPSASPTHSISPTVDGFSAPTLMPTHTTDVSLADMPTREPSAVPTHTAPPTFAPTEESPTALPSHSVGPTVDGFLAPTMMPTHATDVSLADMPSWEPSATPTHTISPTTILDLEKVQASVGSIPHNEGEAVLTGAPVEEAVSKITLTSGPTHTVQPTSVPTHTVEPTSLPTVPTTFPTHTVSPTSIPTHTVSPTSVPTHTAAPTGTPVSHTHHDGESVLTGAPVEEAVSGIFTSVGSIPHNEGETMLTGAPVEEAVSKITLTSGPTHTVQPTSVPTHTVEPTSLPTVPTTFPTHTVSPTSIPTHTVSPTSVPTHTAAPTGTPVSYTHHEGETALSAAPSEEAASKIIPEDRDYHTGDGWSAFPTEEAKTAWKWANLLPASDSSSATFSNQLSKAQLTTAPSEEAAAASAMEASLKKATVTAEPTEEARSWNFGNLLPGSASSFATVDNREVSSDTSLSMASAARSHVRRGYIEGKK